MHPASLEEALSLLSANVDDAKVLAGGQSLLPLMKLRLAKPEVIIDIGGLAELNYIREEDGRIAIGALATYTDVAESELVRSRCPLLTQTAVVVGDVQVRNRGTIGGGLAHADPAEDLPAAILALDAELKAIGPDGERWIPAREFFITMLTTSLMPEELLTGIRVPACDGYKSAYRKASRQAAGFAIVGVAVCLKESAEGVCEDIAIGVTGVADVAFRAEKVEGRPARTKPRRHRHRTRCGPRYRRHRRHRGRQRHTRLPLSTGSSVRRDDGPGGTGRGEIFTSVALKAP